MVDAISRASPRQLPVHIFNLDDVCPTYKEVQNSFLKLKDLCMPSKLFFVITIQYLFLLSLNYLQF